MSGRHRELEARLDYMISRIAKETHDIKDLEQQLTDGQILANEALKEELEEVISGLQEYLRGVRGRAHRAQSECHRLQSQNQALQRLLQDREEQRRQRQDLQEGERAALEAELANERRIREDAEVRVQLENENLMKHINALKAELQSTSKVFIHPDDLLQRLQALTHNLNSDAPETSVGCVLQNAAVEEHLQELQQEVRRLAREERKQAQRLEGEREESRRLQQEREEAQRQQETLSRELQRLRQQLTDMQKQNHQQAREAAKVTSRHKVELQVLREELQRNKEVELQRLREELEDAQEAELQQLREELEVAQEAGLRRLKKKLQESQEAELQGLREELQESQEAELQGLREELQEAQEVELQGLREELQEAQEQQYLMSQRLQEAESEREGLLMELRDQDTQAVEELKRSVCSDDRVAVQQLSAVTHQIHSLYTTAQHIRQQREQDAEQLEDSQRQVAKVAKDLEKAEAESVFLQRLLKDGPSVCNSKSSQHEDLEQLATAIRRLTQQLTQASTDKSVCVEELLGEMVALRNTLKQSSLQDAHRTGHWCWFPTGQSAASGVSQDSGLPSSPQRKPRPQHKPAPKRNHPKETGYWLHSLQPPVRVGSDSAGESDTDSSSPWWFFPADALLYTTQPAQPPPAAHQHVERELHDAQHHLKEQSQLEGEKRDHKYLRLRLRSVLEEVACVEETLLRRRAELREADRLLLHAHTQRKELEQSCGETQRRVEELETRAHNYARLEVNARLLQEAENKLNQRSTEELRVCVEALSQQKRDLEEEVCEGRSHLTLIREELQREKHTLNKLLSELKCAQAQKQEQVTQLDQLQQKCRHLEAKHRHTQRCLLNTENAVRVANTELGRLHAELRQTRDNAGQQLCEQEGVWHSKANKKHTHTTQEAQQGAKGSEQKTHSLQMELDALSEELHRIREKEEKRRCVCGSSPVCVCAGPRDSCSEPDPQPEPNLQLDLKYPSVTHTPTHTPTPTPPHTHTPPSTEPDQPNAFLTPSRTSALITQDEQWRGDLLREKLQRREDELKAQLRRRRRRAQGSLEGLCRRVDWLDQLLGSEETPLKPHQQHQVRLSRSCHSESSDPSGRAVRLDPRLPEREDRSELQPNH